MPCPLFLTPPSPLLLYPLPITLLADTPSPSPLQKLHVALKDDMSAFCFSFLRPPLPLYPLHPSPPAESSCLLLLLFLSSPRSISHLFSQDIFFLCIFFFIIIINSLFIFSQLYYYFLTFFPLSSVFLSLFYYHFHCLSLHSYPFHLCYTFTLPSFSISLLPSFLYSFSFTPFHDSVFLNYSIPSLPPHPSHFSASFHSYHLQLFLTSPPTSSSPFSQPSFHCNTKANDLTCITHSTRH